MQFLELHQRLSEVVLHHEVQDSFSWRWYSGRFSTRSAYLALFTGQSAVLGSLSRFDPGATLFVENMSTFVFAESFLNEIFSGMSSH
jgi:hypothetical protein